jgi:hypothetical protein
MEKIILDDLVKIKLRELTSTLFEEEYFGFVFDAENYVNNIVDFIFSPSLVTSYIRVHPLLHP